MNFQLMQPHPFNANGEPFKVVCARCKVAKSSTDVVCAMDGKAGDFYCGHCAVCVEMDSKNMKDSTNKVIAYHKKLEEYQKLNLVVCNPYFNATKDKEIYDKREQLNKELKEEANNLWELGYNV